MNKKFLLAIALVAVFCLSACTEEEKTIDATVVNEITPEMYENSI